MPDIRIRTCPKRDNATVFATSERGKKWLSTFTYVNVSLVPFVHVSMDASVEYASAAREAGLEVTQ
jgi:hypothetical protein